MIDLDAMERKARESRPGEYIAAIPPPVVIALIARIRELEAALAVSIDTLHFGGYSTDDARLIRDKGAVIP